MTDRRPAMFGLDGQRRGSAYAGASDRVPALLAALGTGMFRYRRDSPSGSRRGTLIRLP
ncbi:MAG TPA: hypothetical protein VJ385_08525 [Fibrobacteria bacterium]|nr:hypothetical protein [Fibrobacteria bacterium]